MREFAIETQWKCVQQLISSFERHHLIHPDAMRIHHVFIGKDVSRRAGYYGGFRSCVLTVLDVIEGRVGRADDSDRLKYLIFPGRILSNSEQQYMTEQITSVVSWSLTYNCIVRPYAICYLSPISIHPVSVSCYAISTHHLQK